jgi:endonuclease/exonuclease/phosphatase (EEP) superfamily protein YafD
VLALLSVAVLRIAAHDAVVPLTWLNAFTLYIYLPAYIALIYAAWTARWWLATVSAAVVACHLSWVLPDYSPATPYRSLATESAEAGQSIRVFHANVRAGNLGVQRMLDEALAADADVIILSEVGRYWLDELRKSDISLKYPFGTDLWHRHGGDVNVFSRRPVSRLEQITIENRATIAVDIPLGEETLRLFAVHSPRPQLRSTDNYDRFWEKLTPLVAAVDGPVVLIGDCNATQHSLVYERLNRNGLRSAHDDRGRGYATTWPNSVWPVPPIRIDQAFLSRDVECISIREGTGFGTDHKPIVVDFVVHPRGPGQDDR